MYLRHQITITLAGLILSTVPVVVPAFAQQQVTPPAASNEDPAVTVTEKKTISPEAMAAADAQSEAAIRAINPAALSNETYPRSSILLRPDREGESVLEQVNHLIAISADSYWNERTKYRQAYSRSISWDTDFCSKSPDTGLSFDFKKPCAHHDFGYTNYKKMGIFNSVRKNYVDAIFYRDMKAHCSTRSIFLKPDCYYTAFLYYQAVQWFGS